MNRLNRSHFWLLLIAYAACSATLVAAMGQAAPGERSPDHAPAQSSDIDAAAGEKVFADNCSRCHIPPMTLSQRVTGTVIQHMRVRARLSHKDQRLLLKFLAP
jgi:cytochrome c5